MRRSALSAFPPLLTGAAILTLAGCLPERAAPPGADRAVPPLTFNGGYRAMEDGCLAVVESTPALDALTPGEADLVACPPDYDGTEDFIDETGAVELEPIEGYRIFRVPIPWQPGE